MQILRPEFEAQLHTFMTSAVCLITNIFVSLSKQETEDDANSRPQKRFVSNEESLVEELSGLKKTAA